MPLRAPRIQPGDVPTETAGRRLGLTAEEFTAALPRLLARGFPEADPTTGLFDLEAIDAWRRARHPQLFGLPPSPAVTNHRIEATKRRLERWGRG